MKWNYNADPKFLYIQKVSESVRGTKLKILYDVQQLSFDAVQVKNNDSDALFQLHSPTETIEVFVLSLSGSNTYEAAMTVQGNVVGTY